MGLTTPACDAVLGQFGQVESAYLENSSKEHVAAARQWSRTPVGYRCLTPVQVMCAQGL